MKLTSATNDSTTRTLFSERLRYVNNYPVGIRDHRVISFWYNEMLFGRVDRQGDVVYPSEAYLKQLHTETAKSYFVLNFVADAYQSFRDDMLLQESQNHFIVSDGTPFEDRFAPTKSWISIHKNYTNYLQNYYDNFCLPFMADPERREDIRDFDDFITEFTRLIDRTSLTIPFTKTEYIVSKYGSPLTSGLMVEFSDQLHGNDPIKILDFINNINFELYREIASRNGFAVDMNAPWRLVADVGSVVMEKFMNPYGVGLNTLFDKYYYNSSMFDIPNLKVYLGHFYNSFVRAYPKMRKPIVTHKDGQTISLTRVEERVILEAKIAQRRYTNAFWIRFYIYLRAKETNRDWDQYKFDHMVKRATDFFVYKGETAMKKFIDKEVKRPPGEYFQVEEYRRGSFRFKRKRE